MVTAQGDSQSASSAGRSCVVWQRKGGKKQCFTQLLPVQLLSTGARLVGSRGVGMGKAVYAGKNRVHGLSNVDSFLVHTAPSVRVEVSFCKARIVGAAECCQAAC